MPEHPKMKLAVIVSQLSVGGAERFVSELVNYLDDLGVEIHLILLFKYPRFYDLNKGVKIYEPEFLLKSTTKVIYFFKIRHFLRFRVKTIKPDSIINIGYVSLVVFCLLGVKFPLYISNRSNPLKRRPLWYKIIRRFMYSYATGIIAQTSVAKEYYTTTTWNKNIAIIPNFVREITPNSETTRHNYIVSVGRFISTKNFDGLIRIFSRVNNKSWKLILLGDGALRNKLESIATEYNIADRVIFTGFQKDVDFWLQQSKIFVFTSLSEGFPNALLEAMATPLPVISYDCPVGPSDIVINEVNGFLIPMGDEDLYIEKLQKLIDDEQLRLSMQKNAIKVREVYSKDKIIRRLLNFVTEPNK